MLAAHPCTEPTDLELCQIPSESSRLSATEQTPRVRAWRTKYDKLFSEAHVPTAAWEQLDNGQWACHVSRMVFATAVQCINHQRKWQYQCDLEASHLREDTAVVKALERKAQEEKEQLRTAAAKQRKKTKRDLTNEVDRLGDLQRRLERELALAEQQLEMMPELHRRELRNVKSTYHSKVKEFARRLEAPLEECLGLDQIHTDHGTPTSGSQGAPRQRETDPSLPTQAGRVQSGPGGLAPSVSVSPTGTPEGTPTPSRTTPAPGRANPGVGRTDDGACPGRWPLWAPKGSPVPGPEADRAPRGVHQCLGLGQIETPHDTSPTGPPPRDCALPFRADRPTGSAGPGPLEQYLRRDAGEGAPAGGPQRAPCQPQSDPPPPTQAGRVRPEPGLAVSQSPLQHVDHWGLNATSTVRPVGQSGGPDARKTKFPTIACSLTPPGRARQAHIAAAVFVPPPVPATTMASQSADGGAHAGEDPPAKTPSEGALRKPQSDRPAAAFRDPVQYLGVGQIETQERPGPGGADPEMPRGGPLQSWLCPWGPAKFDALAGLQSLGIAKFWQSSGSTVPEDVRQAFQDSDVCMQPWPTRRY